MRILLVQGHPDPDATHLCHALAAAYADGAIEMARDVRRVDVATLDFPLLRSQDEWNHHPVPAGLRQAQQDIAWAEHIVFFFPLWLGDMPALLKGFLEQVARPGFAFGEGERNPFAAKALRGRSAHIVVTMGMPAFVYQWYFGAHSIRSLKRNVLGFVGIAPVRSTLIGSVGKLSNKRADALLARMRRMGREAA